MTGLLFKWDDQWFYDHTLGDLAIHARLSIDRAAIERGYANPELFAAALDAELARTADDVRRALYAELAHQGRPMPRPVRQ